MTGTDLARMNNNAVAVLSTTNDALTRLGEWVTAASQAHQLVAPLVGTAFIPDSYKPKVDPRATPEQREEARQTAIANATAAVLQGITLGLDPMTALQQIYIVHGRPGMYAKMMVALVQAHGHEVWDEDLSDSRAVVCGRRKGTEHIVRITVTMQQARTAGWTSNATYTKTPQDMLWARAAARVCDRIASDVIKGVASVEEVQDSIKATAEVGEGTRTVAPRKRTAPAIAAASTEEPPLDDEPITAIAATAEVQPEPALLDDNYVGGPTPDAAPPVQGPGITAPQQKKLHALLNETGRGDRDVALVWISGVIGRELTTTKDLTKREAGTVIDRLENPTPDPEPALDDEWPAVAGPDAA